MVIDAVVITVILIFSISLPMWLYPIIFYLQVIPIVSQYFPVTFNKAQHYLHYISSAANLYFPYDFCLYPGMTALASYSFRYIPFLLTVIISVVLYTANRKFKIAKNMRLSWSGLWLLILLLYTDVVNTSVSILNCPLLSDPDGTKRPRWYVDDTVTCFTGGHLPLAIVAILVLIFCVLIMVFVTAVVMRKIKKHWAFSMAKLLKAPYAEDHSWWAPVELLRRILFIIFIFIIILPGNLAPVLLFTMVCVAVIAYTKPFQTIYVNVLEVFTHVTILLLLSIASTNRFEDPVFKTESDIKESLVDDCGNVNALSEHAAMLVPFYYLPLLVLVVLLIKKVVNKLQLRFRKRSYKFTIVRNTEDFDMLTASQY
ncbi:uncharacterized protein [Dysidea avara]|uniref:uncharacterized protein isoform X1 n=2 Tax=Dysidea avara TaxID=196820 RepID=UPI003334A6FE